MILPNAVRDVQPDTVPTVRYRDMVMTHQRLADFMARKRLAEIEIMRPSLSHDERKAIARVKSWACRNPRLVARYAYIPLGDMSIPRQYAAALCALRGWRYTTAQLS